MPFSSYAEKSSLINNNQPFNINSEHYEEITEFSQKWIENNLPKNCFLTEITNIYSINNELYGYELTFATEFENCGYVVLELNSDAPVVEFALSGANIQTSLLKLNSSIKQTSINSADVINENNSLIFLTPYVYGINVKSGNESYVINTNGDILYYNDINALTIKKSEVSVQSNSGNIFNDFYTISKNAGLHSYYTIKNGTSFVPVEMSGMPAHSSNGSGKAGDYSEGNCGPTCLTNIVKYYKEQRGFSNLLKNNSVNSTYNDLSSRVGYSPTLGTQWWNCGGALKNYVSSRNYKCTVDSYVDDSWEDFVRDISRDYMILMNIRGNNGNGTNVGHLLVGIGWATSYSGTRYIRVVDGWNNHVNRYVVFNGTNFTSFEGCGVNIYN